jgi:hypothetical protein
MAVLVRGRTAVPVVTQRHERAEPRTRAPMLLHHDDPGHIPDERDVVPDTNSRTSKPMYKYYGKQLYRGLVRNSCRRYRSAKPPPATHSSVPPLHCRRTRCCRAAASVPVLAWTPLRSARAPQSRECAACARAGCARKGFARASPIAPGAISSV